MNSNYGKNFDFDLGIGSSRSKPLNDQKNKTSSFSSPSPYSSAAAQSKPAWQPNKPSWTHQPAAPSQPARPAGAPSSMAGDIFGKSWSSSAPSSGIGIVDKNPNLFGDLVNSALGQGKGSNNSNVSLKNSSNNKPSFSMGNMADSLPKSSASSANVNPGINWAGSSPASYNSNAGTTNTNQSSNLGGPAIKNNSIGGIGGGVGIGSKSRDPFVSLVDFGSKPIKNPNPKPSSSNSNDVFGDFLNNPPKSSSNVFPTNNDMFTGSTTTNPSPSLFADDPSPGFNMDDFAKKSSATQIPIQSTVDPLDMLFAPTTQKSEMDDWGTEADFGGGGDSGGPTTELDGLPPPPAGVNASGAKNKGMDNYRQGQYADAIKWLSWAALLLEKSGGGVGATVTEVLSSRASCYKEVGEYKKAVADCTKVLEKDEKNVTVLVQRALLYESMEKYRLGAEDLRTVLKIDPGNRIARSTVHRLSKLAD